MGRTVMPSITRQSAPLGAARPKTMAWLDTTGVRPNDDGATSNTSIGAERMVASGRHTAAYR